ncbi:MAG: adenine deaminase [Bacteroidales bacterium]|nr:adenine deaminase [Bacteroidales bacterium]
MAQSYKVSGRIVDVVSGRIFPGTLEILNGKVESIVEGTDDFGPYILPGLIDAHIHIESSMLVPSEFARLASVHGTVATVSDPHEIANVLGIAGVEFMIENGRQVPFHFNFGAPSCVPATGFESAGAVLDSKEVEKLLQRDDILYLSEMMNFPGVVFQDPEVHAKLTAARKYGKPIDGHAPGVGGDWLKTYAESGISTDHECTDVAEAIEKIKLGMHILIREGSAARNFDNLIPLLNQYPGQIMFCSDDKHPDDLIVGHMNLLLRRAVALGYDPMQAIRCCTLNPVKHYKLSSGLLQKGDSADFILVDSLKDFNVLKTYIDGELVAENGKTNIKAVGSSQPNVFKVGTITPDLLKVKASEGRLKVIEAYDGELLTGKVLIEPVTENGYVQTQPEKDILKLVVINRYQESAPAIGFIKGIGIKSGALASTVAHDSHNLIAVGTSDESICEAIKLIRESKGGIAIWDGEKGTVLPLPVAGIMTDQDGFTAAESYESINNKAHKLGSPLRAPFMTLAFMALLVIPELKLSDKGLFDGKLFAFTDLFEK